MRVTQLWRYPVKSMIGGSVDAVHVAELGIAGDRTWAVRDLERGGIRGAKKIGALMQFGAADLGDGEVEISLPDGSTIATTEADVDERLSAALSHRVRLERLRPASDKEHFRRGPPDTDDIVTELEAIFGREEGEPLPDLSLFPPELVEFESPPGTYYDAFPLLVMTEEALAALAAALPGTTVDVRRFRPSIVLGSGGEAGHPEFGWSGRAARIGSVVIEFFAPCPRCVMVTREIDETVPADRRVLRHIVRDLDQNVGIYARILSPGQIHLGDQLEFT